MASTNINWKDIKEKISRLDIDIIPFEQCTLGNQIGTGAAMIVYEGSAHVKNVTKKVAFKEHQKLKNQRLRPPEAGQILTELTHEISLMKKMKYHPNIVQIFGVTFNKMWPILVVELGEDVLNYYLSDRHRSGNTAGWSVKALLCLDILRGIRCLHDADIVHGDLKGENILVFHITSSVPRAKISDFGYSSTLSSLQSTVGGTPNFMSPESTGKYPDLLIWKKKFTQDIYSFGLVIYQTAANGEKPYDYDTSSTIFDAKDADRDLAILLAQLPSDTPVQFRSAIFEASKFMPPDRASLDTIEEMLNRIILSHQQSLSDASRHVFQKSKKQYVENDIELTTNIGLKYFQSGSWISVATTSEEWYFVSLLSDYLII